MKTKIFSRIATKIKDIFKDVRDTRERLEDLGEEIAHTEMEIRA